MAFSPILIANAGVRYLPRSTPKTSMFHTRFLIGVSENLSVPSLCTNLPFLCQQGDAVVEMWTEDHIGIIVFGTFDGRRYFKNRWLEEHQ